MNFLSKWLAALAFGLAALTVAASPAAPQNGVEYITLETPQPTDTGNKIEVIEFFGYFCSHCYSFDPVLKDWMKKQGSNIVFKRVAVDFGAASMPQQKLFYTLSAMGQLDALHSRIFNAVQVERLPFRRDEQIFDFVEKNGVNRAQFMELYNSSSIDSYSRAAKQLQGLFKVDGVPLIAIDGRYLTSPAMAAKGAGNLSESQLQAATLQVMDALVAKARRERGTKSVIRL